MGLAGREIIAQIVACPRCRNPVSIDTQNCRCTNATCAFHLDGFPLVGGVPVLVDFDDSILFKNELMSSGAASPVQRRRRSGLARRVMAALLPANEVAAANATLLRTLLGPTSERKRVLIVGGGSIGAGTQTLYDDGSLDLISFDVYHSDIINFVGDAHSIPISDGSVDAVWIQAVLEHVLDPSRVVDEIHRVLRPGGLVYAETPFMQQVHEGPYDFTRFTASGHRWLFRRFEVIGSGVVLGPGSQLVWSIEHLARGLFRSVRAGLIAKLLFFWLKYFDRLIPEAYALDAASAVYFLGRATDRTVAARDMPSEYRGAHGRKTLGVAESRAG